MPDRPYAWNARAGRYRNPATGRFVSLPQVRAAIDRALDRAEAEVRHLSEQLRDGQVSLVQWELQMRDLVKDVHLYSAAAAKGGWAQLSQADLGTVGRAVRDQYAFLRGFGTEIAAGLPRDGRFLQRTALYARAGRGMYHRVEMREHEVRGATRYRNVLAPSDHCAGCLAETARGWVPLGELVPIGARDCRSNDKCSLSYQDADGNVIP